MQMRDMKRMTMTRKPRERQEEMNCPKQKRKRKRKKVEEDRTHRSLEDRRKHEGKSMGRKRAR